VTQATHPVPFDELVCELTSVFLIHLVCCDLKMSHVPRSWDTAPVPGARSIRVAPKAKPTAGRSMHIPYIRLYLEAPHTAQSSSQEAKKASSKHLSEKDGSISHHHAPVWGGFIEQPEGTHTTGCRSSEGETTRGYSTVRATVTLYCVRVGLG